MPEIIGLPSDITPSKARLAAEIASEAMLDMAAENLGLTMSTVRIYLKRIFLKFRTSRQVKLLSWILSLMVRLEKLIRILGKRPTSVHKIRRIKASYIKLESEASFGVSLFCADRVGFINGDYPITK